MVNKTALARERAKRCEWCAKSSRPLFGTSVHKVYPMNAGSGAFRDPSIKGPFSEYLPCGCTDISNADLYEELAKERDTFAKALHDCLGILKIALSDMSGAFVNAVCEEELPRFERLDAIRAAREKETA